MNMIGHNAIRQYLEPFTIVIANRIRNDFSNTIFFEIKGARRTFMKCVIPFPKQPSLFDIFYSISFIPIINRSQHSLAFLRLIF